MVDAFKDRLNLYLSDPAPERFRLLQEALAHSPEYQPYNIARVRPINCLNKTNS